MPSTIQQRQTCQQQNSIQYPNLVRYKKPLTKKRTGYNNYSPNSWDLDTAKRMMDPFEVRIMNFVHSNESEFRSSYIASAKLTCMDRKTFINRMNRLTTTYHCDEIVPIIKTKSQSKWNGANHYCINPEYLERAIWGNNANVVRLGKKFSYPQAGPSVGLLRNKPTVYSCAEFEWDGLLDDEQTYQHLTIVNEYGDLGNTDAVELQQNNNKKSDKKENKKINIAVDAVPLSLLRTPQAEEKPATLGVLKRVQRRRRTEKDMKASDVLKKRVKDFKKDENKKNINDLVNQLCGVTDKSKLKTRFGLKDRSFIRAYSDD